jgi:hypothetical protein
MTRKMDADYLSAECNQLLRPLLTEHHSWLDSPILSPMWLRETETPWSVIQHNVL